MQKIALDFNVLEQLSAIKWGHEVTPLNCGLRYRASHTLHTASGILGGALLLWRWHAGIHIGHR